MPRYTYLACDTLTGAVIEELPLRDVAFTNRINSPDGWDGQLPLFDRAKLPPGWLAATEPYKASLYIDRDGVPVGGGLVTTRSYNSERRSVRLSGLGFMHYFARRCITYSQYRPDVDQITLVTDLITTAQAVDGGDIGVTVAAAPSGVLRTAQYNAWERRYVGEFIDQLQAMDDGFDYRLDLTYVDGAPAKTLRLGYPRLGASPATTGLVLSLPGNVVDYSWPEDGTQMRTTTHGLGNGEGPAMVIASASTPALLDGGYPLLESTASFKDEPDARSLEARTRGLQAALDSPVVLPSFTLRADADPQLGSFAAGDSFRCLIKDDRFPDGLDTVMRVISYTVRPGVAGSPETVTVTAGDA